MIKQEDGWTALMIASDRDGHNEVAGQLLENRAKVDLEKEDGWTALMIASMKGQSKVAGKLLENGAKVDLQKEDGWTALMSASQNGHSEVAGQLLRRTESKVDLQALKLCHTGNA